MVMEFDRDLDIPATTTSETAFNAAKGAIDGGGAAASKPRARPRIPLYRVGTMYPFLEVEEVCAPVGPQDAIMV